MSRKYTPFNEHIIIRRNAEQETSESGLVYIPEEHRDKPQEGEVLAVGRGYVTKDGIIPLQVAEGDLVVFGRYSGNDVKMGGEMVCIIKEDELLASYEVTGEDELIQEPKPVKEQYVDQFRYEFLQATARSLRKEGYSLPGTTAALRDANEQCQPQLSDKELEEITDKVFSEDE